MLEVTKFSPGKINLYLEVQSKRADGYHNIDSLMTFLDIGDQISVKKSDKFHLKIEGDFSQSLENRVNLIEVTLSKLEKFYKRKFSVEVILKKNLPIASGMAGGSSNAATFIKCVREMYELEELNGFESFLLSLGADVPFCYNGRSAIVSGIGEKIEFIKDLRNYLILLINPKVEVATEDMFQSLNMKKQFSDLTEKKNNKYLNSIDYLKSRRNDLEKYAVKKNKIIGEILSKLSSCKGTLLSRMTGSGATCFALFKNVKDLEVAKNDVRKSFKKCWIKSAKLINSVSHI